MAVDVRKGQGDVKLTREEFERRLRERFFDPAFEKIERQIADVVTRVPASGKPEPASPIRNSNCRSNGSRHARVSSRRSVSRRTRAVEAACSSSAGRRATIKRVRARCRRRFVSRHRLATRSSTPAFSVTSSI
jgi:hypothetical protein